MNRKERAVRGMEAGLTLVELMVGLSILAILMALAAPSFNQYLRNTEVTAAQNELVTAFNVARSEAIKRSRRVSACSSADGATCSNNNNWASGFIVFTDATGVAGTLDAADRLLHSFQGLTGSPLVVSNKEAAAFIQFSPTGVLVNNQERHFNINADGCPEGSRRLTVTVSPLGAIRNKRGTCAAPAAEKPS